MPQGVNEAESKFYVEYDSKTRITTTGNDIYDKGTTPNFIDILTDPRQVAWMWEGTADSGIPPKDHATQINTLGLYITR